MEKKNNNYFLYHFFATIIKIAGIIVFGGKVIGKENIPKDKGCILAGNHLSDYDAYLFYLSTNRPVHFIAKKELLEGRFGWFFRIMLLIPVDRQKHNPEAKETTVNLLKDNQVVCIFPEGTYHKTTTLLPFKPGAINYAETANVPIIPFAIISTFKFRCRPKIVFGSPIDVSKIKGDKVKYLEDVVLDLINKNS